MRKILSLFAAFCLILSLLVGCGDKEQRVVENNTENSVETKPQEAVLSSTDEDMFTSRDSKIDYDAEKAIKIELKGDSVTASDSSVKVSGTIVTVTKDTTHIVSGTLNNGMIIVDADDTAKLQLVLNGANITSKTSAPLYIKEADKVFVTLVGESILTSGESFEKIDDSSIDGTVFSKQDLTFNGSGSLTVSSPTGHGIVGNDDLCFMGGSYTITSASHGIQANDSVRIKNANISADTGKDGIHSENNDDTAKGFVYISDGNIKIESEGDGISSGSYTQINGGNFEILSGGGYKNGTKEYSDNFGSFGGGDGMHGGMRPGGGSSPQAREIQDTSSDTEDSDIATSMKGIKSGSSMLISGGTFKINSADDSVHSNLSATIGAGTFECASGDDAIHADETLTVKNGDINITQCYEGLEALHIQISGGNIKLVASDDGLNAAGGTDSSGMGGRDEMFGGRPNGGGMTANSDGSIVVMGGTLYINASGDGIDANGTLEITGGHTIVVGPTHGDTATLDYDVKGTITGGTFIGTGANNMAQSFSDGKQGVLAVTVGNQSAYTKIVLRDKNGKELISYAPELSFQVVILSTPEMKAGETYTITVGTETGKFEAS